MFSKRKNRGYIEGLTFAEEASMGLQNPKSHFMTESRSDKEVDAFRQGMADYFIHMRRLEEWCNEDQNEEPVDGESEPSERSDELDSPHTFYQLGEIRCENTA